MKKPLKLIRNISKIFFPAFVIGIIYCLVEMIISDRPFMALGLMLICIGMALACANMQMFLDGIMKGEMKHGHKDKSDSQAA